MVTYQWRSVIGRVLNGSHWPTLLRTDSTAFSRVSKRVTIISCFLTIASIVIAIVSVVTPLGLSEGIAIGSSKDVDFQYVTDTSPIGKATLSFPRASYNHSRKCGYYLPINCPGQEHGWEFWENRTGLYGQGGDDTAYMSTAIPRNITEIFSSGSSGDKSTVAGLFDIQYRSFINVKTANASNSSLDQRQGPKYDPDEFRTKGTITPMESFLLRDEYVIVEGLVVDTKKGGIGFRNHTMPVHSEAGTEWKEGLLWIQPETVCIPSNLTVDYTIVEYSSLDKGQSVISDRGGFTNLTKDYPTFNANTTQEKPELFQRAYKAAVLNNFNLMKFYNLTRENSSIGKTYKLGSFNPHPNRVTLDSFMTNGPKLPSATFNIYSRGFSVNNNASDSFMKDIGVITKPTPILRIIGNY